MLTVPRFRKRDHRAAPWIVRLAVSCILLAIAGIVALSHPDTVSAHAALETSDPANGDVLAASPRFVVARFTEPLERSYSRMELYDSQGNPVPGTALSEGDDAFTMQLALPSTLPNGTYSILWRSLSTADGHSAQNYFAFTIGSDADIASVVIPGAESTESTAPQWAKTLSRWAALLGLALLIAAWPVWSVIIRPSLGQVWRSGPGFVRRMKRYVLVAVMLALAGSIAALVVQSLSIPDGSPFDKIINTLGQTRYGRLWLARMALIVIEALVLAACGWWLTRRRQGEGAVAWVIAAALPIPFSLIAHASAQRSGRWFATVADSVHLFAASIWIGGVAILVFVLLPGLRALDPSQRRRVLATAIPRFSVLALIAMAAIGITGFYAGWLHVGNLTALRTTDYGRALIVKLGVLAVILIIAAINLLVIERRLTRRGGDNPIPFWSTRLRWTVGGELALILVLLLAVGQMTSLQPARDVVVERSRQISVPLAGESADPTLFLAPGVAGLNHFRLQVPGPDLGTDTEALLRLTIPTRPDLGTKEVPLARVSGNAFEHHGSELSIADTWEITAILRQPGTAQLQAESTVAIGTAAPNLDVPGDPWRFRTTGGVTGLALILLGIAGGILAMFTRSARSRKESGGLGFAALLLGVILLVQSRIDPALANAAGDSAIDPSDVAMVARGEEIYTTMCLSCHGPELRGDGPASAGMEPPPADFSQQHTMVHSDEDLLYWLRNGIQGSAMPAFDDTLSDQGMIDVLSYIQYRQQRFGEAAGEATPAAASANCAVQPRTMAEITALAGSGPPAATIAPAPVTAPTIDDPVNQLALDTGHHSDTTSGGAATIRAQLILVRSGDRWLIDEIRPQ